jgi:type VI secretion system protein ImpJ
MAWDNKPVWSEGMFLQTQHFQQFDRYVERLVRGRAWGLRPHGWGLAALRINRDLLATGRFAVATARGVLEDGTPFSIPDDADQPSPLVLPENARNATVYLGLPVRQPGAGEIDRAERVETTARYAISEFDAGDANLYSEAVARIQVGRLRFRYLLETDELAGYTLVGLARVREVRTDRNVDLDDQYIPPMLACGEDPVLAGYLDTIKGLLHHRGEALAARVAAPSSGGAAEWADFLLLQAVNRAEPLFTHLSATAETHPEVFYRHAAALAGDLATFTAKGRRPPVFPAYRHHDLQRTFQPVMQEIERSLKAVLEQTAIPIPLEGPRSGVYLGRIADRSLLDTAQFVLAVRANVQAEAIRRNFPSQVKIGSSAQIRDLVNNALPGIVTLPMPVAPRQMPHYAGAVYFEMDRASRYWQELKAAGNIAIHVAGEYPDLRMECWAIRDASG